MHFDDLFDVKNNQIFTRVSVRMNGEVVEPDTHIPNGIGPGQFDLNGYMGRNLEIEDIDDIYEIKGFYQNV